MLLLNIGFWPWTVIIGRLPEANVGQQYVRQSVARSRCRWPDCDHQLMAIDRDNQSMVVTVDGHQPSTLIILSLVCHLSVHPFVQFAKIDYQYKFVETRVSLYDPTPTERPLYHTVSVMLSTLIANSVEKIGVNYPPHCITHKPLWWPRLYVLAFWAANQVVY